MSLLKILDVSSSAIMAEGQRLNLVASNLANAESVAGPDGEPYKARAAVFQTRPGAAGQTGVRVADIVEDQTPAARHYDPSHPMADGEGYVTQSNVNPIEEMVNMISASRSYQNNIEVMNTAQQLMLKTLAMGQ